jgi:PAS domain S-box-containing protein
MSSASDHVIDGELEARPAPEPPATEEALRRLARCAAVMGPELYREIVLALAEALGARWALMGELVDRDGYSTGFATSPNGGLPSSSSSLRAARTLAVVADGELLDDDEYPLPGTPCREVLRQGATLQLTADLEERFPALYRPGGGPVRDYVGTPLRGADGTTLGLLAVLHDEPLDPAREPAALLELLAGRAAAALEADRTMQALRRSEAALADFFDNSAVGLHWVDGRGVIIRANRAELEMMGYLGHEAEYVGRHIADLHADRPTIDEILARLTRGETLEDFPARMVRRDGSIRHVLITSSALFEGGRFVHTRCFTRDVTDQRHAEEALRRSEELSRSLIDSSPDCIKVLDLEGRLRSMSEGGQRRMAIEDLGPYLRQPWIEWWQEHRSQAEEAVRAAASGNEGRFEGFCAAADGTPRWWDVVVTPILGHDGQPERLLAVSRDVTDRREDQERLRESEERLRIAKAAAFLGLHDFDVPSGTVKWDDRTRELWGVDPGEPITYELWRASLHPDDVEEAEAAVNRALDPAGSGQYFAQYRVTHRKDGITRWIEATGRTHFVAGKPLRIVGTVQDITERKLTEEALREADRRKDEFLATLGHELRNPLAPIRAAVGVLELAKDDPSRWREMTAIIDRQSTHLVRLIDDLLDVSRITRGKITLRRQRLDLAEILERAEEGIRPVAEGRHLTFSAVGPAEPIHLEGDPVRLTQVLGNLLSNAFKYTPDGGAIRLTAGRVGEWAVIRVEDTGHGIEPEQLPEIFEMFSQSEGPAAYQEGGLGVGLSLARALTQLHGGTIEADSGGPGQGSVFTVRLPLAPGPVPPASSQADRGVEQELPPRRILTVDDNADVCRSIAVYLRLGGHQVETASSGEEALQIADESRPDVVLLDIGLPGIDGYEVARRMRHRPWGEGVLLVAMTGWGQSEDKRRAREAGFDAHLTKPVAPENLLDVLSRRRPGEGSGKARR